ncbi:MAG: selenide, water dikinase SelD [Bacteroidetes bacterium]|nr:selenide, water dikinase SelD [Bacteroidota bacterium]
MFTLEGKKPEATRLTQYSKGSGCGCKVAPAVLAEILSGSKTGHTIDRLLLVGNDTSDDAAVYDLGNGTALISTTDFFTPIVDDAYDYGRIAAANAISDVYAMGGRPLMAIAVMGLPVEKLPADIAREIIRGAKDICAKAGITLAGGHTIDAPEPFFGLSVNGMVAIKDLKRNSTAQAGDALYLTKPIGVGMMATALKRGLRTADEIRPAIEQMATLNSFGAVVAQHDYVHAMTDVTGFGLLGHLIEVCEGSGVSAQIDYSQVPLLDGVTELTAAYVYADNTMRNWKSYEAKVAGVDGERLLTLCDPQTSGGLLIAVAPEAEQVFRLVAEGAGQAVWRVGELVERGEKVVYVGD